MQLKTKIIAAVLLSGLVPAGVGLAIGGLQSHASFSELTEKAQTELGQHVVARIETRLTTTAAQVEQLVDEWKREALLFASRPDTLRAVEDFQRTAQELSQRSDDGHSLEAERSAVRQFYSTHYGARFARNNEGETPPTRELMAGLDDVAAALQAAYLAHNPNAAGALGQLDAASTNTAYDQVHQRFHPTAQQLLSTADYADVILVDTQTARVVYSAAKEIDFGVRLVAGPHASSGLGEAFRLARSSTNATKVHFVDYQSYLPSDNAPAAFLSTPIRDQETTTGVLVFRVPTDRLQASVANHSGLGQSGELLLVGPDMLPRSDSRLMPIPYSSDHACRHPGSARLDLPELKAAIQANEHGTLRTKDYRGTDVILSHQSIDLLGTRWSLLGKMDVAEALRGAAAVRAIGTSAQSSILMWSLILLALSSLIIIPCAFWLARQVAKPLDATLTRMKDIATGDGDLTQRLDESSQDEFGDLARAFNAFLERLQNLVREAAEGTQEVERSAHSVYSTAQGLSSSAEQSKQESCQLASAAEEMSINMREVSVAADAMSTRIAAAATGVAQITSSIAEVAANAEQSAKVTAKASKLATESNDKISQFNAAAIEIGRVIETIQDIAEQTNLLALNATIEAARAGEAGKGFSVVASEVKDLARQTAEATEDIRERIERMQESTRDVVSSISAIGTVMSDVDKYSKSIATSVGEQRGATESVSVTLDETSNSVNTVAHTVSQSAAASSEITENLARLDANNRNTASGADDARSAGQLMQLLSKQLGEKVRQFKF